MKKEEKVINENLYRYEDGKLIVLPDGIFIWNKILDFLKTKLFKINYQEIYTSSLENFIINKSGKYFTLSYEEQNIKLITRGNFDREIEEARNNAIDLVEVFNVLGKELLAIPFYLGKDVNNENYNFITTQFGSSNIFTNFIGKINEYYSTESSIDISVLKTICDIHKDDKGLMLPPKISPTQVAILPLKQNEKGVLKACRELNEKLLNFGIRSIVDEGNMLNKDKKEIYFEKGIPLIIEIGPRDLEREELELTLRDSLKETILKNDLNICININNLLSSIQKNLFNRALDNLLDSEIELINKESLNQLEKEHIYKMNWCGNSLCLNENSENIKLISFNQQIFGEICPICQKKAKHVVSIIKK